MIMDQSPQLIVPGHYQHGRPAIIRPERFKSNVFERHASIPFGMYKPAIVPATSLYDILSTAGFTTNLKLCLDAATISSYAGGQSWLDLSGGGYDFFRGADGTSDAAEPTFNGAINGGSSSEYWSFDGGDYFTYDTTNETWMENLHKNNAIFSWIIVAYIGAGSTAQAMIGNASGVGGGIGIGIYVSSADAYKFRALSASAQSDLTHGTTVTTGAWHFFGGAVNEATGANGSRLVLDGTATQYTSTYTTPSASNASNTLKIGRGGNGSNLTNNSRIAMLAMWEGTALSSVNLASIRTAIQSARPGLI